MNERIMGAERIMGLQNCAALLLAGGGGDGGAGEAAENNGAAARCSKGCSSSLV
jgi:hypothetical protein